MRQPFKGIENLEAAYDLETPEDNIKLYAAWADTYDAGYRTSMDYILHQHVGEAYHSVNGGPKVLDIGAGTGALAEVLGLLGEYHIDATDISQEMLDVAAEKGMYASLFCADVTKGLPVVDNTYDGIVSSGTFTLGHVGPAALAELLRVTKRGGHIVISVNDYHWHALKFPIELEMLANQYARFETRIVPIYGPDADHEHSADQARLLLMTK